MKVTLVRRSNCMAKPKRNEPCPCGSGKKYKKCCGKNNVIVFDSSLYKIEINQLYADLLAFAFEQHDNELQEIADKLIEKFYPKGIDEEIELYTELVKGWAIFKLLFKEDETIFDLFYQKVNRKIKYPAVKKTFKKWSTPHISVFEVFPKKEYVELQDLATKKFFKTSLNEEYEYKEGNLAVGILVPFSDNYEFLNVMIQLPGDMLEIVTDLIEEKLPIDEELEDVFPEFLADLLLIDSDVRFSMEMFDWSHFDHEMVASQFRTHAMKKDYDEKHIFMAIQYWYDYCQIHFPIIRKHAAHAAALDYFSHVEFFPFTNVTQEQLAKEYGTSPGAISNNYNKLSAKFELMTESFETEIPSANQPNIEKHLRDLMRTIEGQEFDSDEDLDEFIQDVMDWDELPASESPRDIAQDLLFDAQEATGVRRKKLIQEALEVYPNSPDAYLLLAEDERNVERHVELLEKAVQVGEKDLGKKFFMKNRGHFWGLVETRPYMRAKATYAMALEDNGLMEKAIQTYEDLLNLNPNDNQGIRYLLLPLYLEEDFEATHDLLKEYDEPSATFMYSKALLMYKEEGITNASIKALEDAEESNPHVMNYLLGNKKIPDESPRYVGIGDEQEAIAYVQENIHLWTGTKEFLKKLST